MIKYYRLLLILALTSCVKSDGYADFEEICNNKIIATKTVQEIFDIASSTATKYNDNDVIEGYVVSTDQFGNFFKSLSLQTIDGTIGFSVAIDQTDLYTMYNPGRKVIIKLQNRYIEFDNDALEIGDLYIDNFNNETVGRISYPLFEKVVIKTCDVVDENSLVHKISISDIEDRYLNTLVEFSNVQFTEESLGNNLHDADIEDDPFATTLLLQDTSGNTLLFRTSAFADYANTAVSANSGKIRGVLSKYKGDYQLLSRSINDINLTDDRFVIELKNNIFFTELADPNNNSGARFIEIYNAENESINLNGWTVRRYTNNNTAVSSTIDLSGSTIDAGQAFVIASNASEFESVFGFAPDLTAGPNSPAGSNGDDNLELVDSEGTVVDFFGVIGEDGSGTNHEFEDGRAFRKLSVVVGSSVYIFSEWQIWNDTGDAGTINKPQDAPGDFSPGVR